MYIHESCAQSVCGNTHVSTVIERMSLWVHTQSSEDVAPKLKVNESI